MQSGVELRRSTPWRLVMFPSLIFLLLTVLVFLHMAGGLYFSLLMVRPKCYSVEETYWTEIETGNMSEAEWQSWERQDVILLSPFGYDLFGVHLPLTGTERTVIIAHVSMDDSKRSLTFTVRYPPKDGSRLAGLF